MLMATMDVDSNDSVDNVFDPLLYPIPFDEQNVIIPDDEDTAFQALRFNDLATFDRRLHEGFNINNKHPEPKGGKIYTVQCQGRMMRSLRLKEYTILHVAVIHGTIKTIEAVLSYGSDVNALDANKFSPISTAVAVNRPDVVRLLVDRGADVNIQSASGRTPIIIAIENASLTMVQDLLDAGADPNLPDSQGTTPLFMCFKSKHSHNLDVVRALIQGGSKINMANKQGATPLMMAAAAGEIAAAQVLLELGADINIMDSSGKNAFHMCSGVKMALYLFNNGATTDYPDKHGQRPIDAAVKVGHYGRIRLLLGSDSRRSVAILEDPTIMEARKNLPIFDQWLLEELYEPRELKRLCRQVIRECLSPFNTVKICELPIPGLLKDYLLAKHIDLSYDNLICDREVLRARLAASANLLNKS
ncbi:unnamed protein product [Lymnaea stagnalis]|uniref:SOCS box domain-containing protein n=1 Tax=Lymnaea stagnalis TaxID=6523 RepID=A0AAV2HL73_LYMST